jgi:hypothetical protein
VDKTASYPLDAHAKIPAFPQVLIALNVMIFMIKTGLSTENRDPNNRSNKKDRSKDP